jgi:hypothetical protein
VDQHDLERDPAAILRRAAESADATGDTLNAELARLWRTVAADLQCGAHAPPMNARILLGAVRSARVFLGLAPQQE